MSDLADWIRTHDVRTIGRRRAQEGWDASAEHRLIHREGYANREVVGVEDGLLLKVRQDVNSPVRAIGADRVAQPAVEPPRAVVGHHGRPRNIPDRPITDDSARRKRPSGLMGSV